MAFEQMDWHVGKFFFSWLNGMFSKYRHFPIKFPGFCIVFKQCWRKNVRIKAIAFLLKGW